MNTDKHSHWLVMFLSQYNDLQYDVTFYDHHTHFYAKNVL